MSTVRKRYVVDKRDEYTIEYRPKADGTFEIYATDYPWCPYDTSDVKTHVFPSSGRVCVLPGREPRTLARAMAIAMVWMRGYSTYVRTGTFPNGGGKVEVG